MEEVFWHVFIQNEVIVIQVIDLSAHTLLENKELIFESHKGIGTVSISFWQPI